MRYWVLSVLGSAMLYLHVYFLLNITDTICEVTCNDNFEPQSLLILGCYFTRLCF